jgi:hypothetical protein
LNSSGVTRFPFMLRLPIGPLFARTNAMAGCCAVCVVALASAPTVIHAAEASTPAVDPRLGLDSAQRPLRHEQDEHRLGLRAGEQTHRGFGHAPVPRGLACLAKDPLARHPADDDAG